LINRYYDPTTASFLSVDPLVGLTEQPYGYGGSDPVNNSDPTGLSWYDPSWVNDAASGVTNRLADAWNATGGLVVHTAATHTFGLCLNGASGFGAYGTVSGCVALVGGVPTIFGSAGFGANTTPSASVTGGLLISNAHTGTQLSRWFAMAGGSANVGPFSVGDDASVGVDSCNSTIWENQVEGGLAARFPFALSAEGHSAITYTWVGP
jgi:hypothetical protein